MTETVTMTDSEYDCRMELWLAGAAAHPDDTEHCVRTLDPDGDPDFQYCTFDVDAEWNIDMYIWDTFNHYCSQTSLVVTDSYFDYDRNYWVVTILEMSDRFWSRYELERAEQPST